MNLEKMQGMSTVPQGTSRLAFKKFLCYIAKEQTASKTHEFKKNAGPEQKIIIVYNNLLPFLNLE